MSEIQETVITTKEYSYEYQAVDDLGRPLGAKQIFKGSTQQEVLDKIAEANKNLIKLNRELNKKIRLGEFESDVLPPDAVRVTNNSLKPRELTIDEKAQFARDILDPDKFDEVNTKLIEAQFGAKPEEIRERINNQERRLENIEARQEAEAFAYANPDYYVCPDNFRTITAWMVKNNLRPVRENFQLAYDTLKREGLMVSAPIPEPTAVIDVVHSTPLISAPEPIAVPDPVTLPVVEIPAPVRQPSGLTRDIASNVGTPTPKSSLTIRDIEKMPSDEYKRRLLTDKNFAKLVDDLYAKK